MLKIFTDVEELHKLLAALNKRVTELEIGLGAQPEKVDTKQPRHRPFHREAAIISLMGGGAAKNVDQIHRELQHNTGKKYKRHSIAAYCSLLFNKGVLERPYKSVYKLKA